MTSPALVRYGLLLAFVSTAATCTERETVTGESAQGAASGNPISGEGLPNPNPVVVRNWGELPEGRTWGTTAGIDIDPTDGHVWAYERCGSGGLGGGGMDCDSNPVDPVFKFDRNTGEILANFGAGLMVIPHGIHVDSAGNVWVTDFTANAEGTKGHQVFKFSPEGEVLMTLGTPGVAGTGPDELNQPNDVVTAPDGSIFVSDGHSGQNQTSRGEIQAAREAGLTGRIIKFDAQGNKLMEWGRIGLEHGEFRTPHALAFDSRGRLWVADRGNHRIEIFDQEGNHLDSRYLYGRISGIFITDDDMVYAIDSESSPLNHPNWLNGVRVGPVDEDRIVAFIPPFEREDRLDQGTAGEGVAVDADGNVYAAEGPNSLEWAGGAFTKYEGGS
ncbi:MAG: hypothetical protein R3304_11125 [Longimicrobiales bacterium]|nr:hypothetical protein [Longimicrobiales bacterium]